MLRILGSHKRLCDGFSRRDFLQAGGLGLLGLGAQSILDKSTAASAEAAARGPSFGRAKRCVLLYLYGAASQIETFDPKPDAPSEVRGDLGVISTSVPGIQIGELLPRVAKIIDRATIVRSMTHPYPLHASAFTLTSIPTIDVPLQMSPRDPRHWPFIGSVVDFLADERGDPRPPSRAISACLGDSAPGVPTRPETTPGRTARGWGAATIRFGPISKVAARAPRPTPSASRRFAARILTDRWSPTAALGFPPMPDCRRD